MKDQCKLLRSCIHKDIPACVLQGDDSCMAEILEAALSIYLRNGCSIEFLYDFQLLINEVKAYQAENPCNIKLPKLLPGEEELIREEMEWMSTQQIRNETASNWKRDNELRETMSKYQITIDGNLYEEAEQITMAMYLYNTVDKTCLHDYNGHQKELIADGKTIRSDRIRTSLEKENNTQI